MNILKERFFGRLSALPPKSVKFDSAIRSALLELLPEQYVRALERELVRLLHQRRSPAAPKPSQAREGRRRLAGQLEKIAEKLGGMDDSLMPPGFDMQRFDALLQGMDELALAMLEAAQEERALEIQQRESEGKTDPTRSGGPRTRHDENLLARRVLAIIGAAFPSASDNEKRGYALAALQQCLIPLGVPADEVEDRADSLLSRISKASPLPKH